VFSSSPEELARRFFGFVSERNLRRLEQLLHPEVEFLPVTMAEAYRGREAVINDFYATVFRWPVYEVDATSFERASEHSVDVGGRQRWMSNGHLSDTHAAWTLTFTDGQLHNLRTHART
jgi:ketosteroid isomerase-like protein